MPEESKRLEDTLNKDRIGSPTYSPKVSVKRQDRVLELDEIEHMNIGNLRGCEVTVLSMPVRILTSEDEGFPKTTQTENAKLVVESLNVNMLYRSTGLEGDARYLLENTYGASWDHTFGGV